MATAGAVPVWDCTGVGRSTAPPSTPAVPTSIVRRNTESGRTVFSVIAFPPSFSWFEPAGAAADRGHSTGAEWKRAFICRRGAHRSRTRRDSAGISEASSQRAALPWRRGPPSLVRPAIERRVRLLQTIHRNVAAIDVDADGR